MRRLAWLLLLLLSTSVSAGSYSSNSPRTTNNDDSCDIALLPAATLLLPYFEVDVDASAGAGETTLFTVTNTFELPQAVRVTLWTDYALPVIAFNLYLTGYDVQSINLYDVIVRGLIAPDLGTGSDVSPVGDLSGDPVADVDYDNPDLDEASCVRLPVGLPSAYVSRMQQAFTLGILPAIGSIPECRKIGGVHENAIGYATIDVVGACTNNLPVDAPYFASDIRYANVLVGDYQQVNGAEDYAQANPLVHIRAIPDGGSRATPTNLTRTFYSRLQPAASATSDRRQPLPHLFTARWIAGGATQFETSFKVWREAKTAAGAGCAAYEANGSITMPEVLRFDEEENVETLAPDHQFLPPQFPRYPATSLVSVDDYARLPANAQNAVAGWLYLNFDDAEADAIARQNWVVVSMRAEKRFSADIDAQALGNGCSAPTPRSNAMDPLGKPPGPAPDITP